MFGLKNPIKKAVAVRLVPVTGLCHNCFRSGVEISPTYEMLCVNCAPEIDIRPEIPD